MCTRWVARILGILSALAFPGFASGEAAEVQAPLVRSKLDADFYGFIKLDALYDSRITLPGDIVSSVARPGRFEDQFILSANQTRFGFDLAGPHDEPLAVTAKLELDFYSYTGAAENKVPPRIRQAYAKVFWKEANLTLLAGQAWDLFAPLNARSLQHLAMLNWGNVGERHPQVQIIKGYDFPDKSKLSVAMGLLRATGADSAGGTVASSADDVNRPILTFRAALTTPLRATKPATIGFSGHWGRERYFVAATSTTPERDPGLRTTASVNVDLDLPISDRLAVMAEGFRGRNFGDFFGAINQRLNPTTLEEVDTIGGWAQISFGPHDRWHFNVGAGIDDPFDSDASGTMITANRALFGNIYYALTRSMDLGFEVSRFLTEYVDIGVTNSTRFHAAFILNF